MNPGAMQDAELALLVGKTQGLQPWRRVFHAANGILFALALLYLFPTQRTAVVVIAGVLGVALILDVIRLRDPRANALFFRTFRIFASPREARKFASSTWYLVGVLLVLLLFPLSAVIPGILVLAFADPAASVVGRRWGRHSLGKGTVEGSAAFALVAFAVLAMFLPLPAALVGAAAVAVVEILPLGLDDNLTIPLTVATAVVLLG